MEKERDKENHRQHYNNKKDITFLSSSRVLNFPLSSRTIIIHYTCLFSGDNYNFPLSFHIYYLLDVHFGADYKPLQVCVSTTHLKGSQFYSWQHVCGEAAF